MVEVEVVVRDDIPTVDSNSETQCLLKKLPIISLKRDNNLHVSSVDKRAIFRSVIEGIWIIKENRYI